MGSTPVRIHFLHLGRRIEQAFQIAVQLFLFFFSNVNVS